MKKLLMLIIIAVLAIMMGAGLRRTLRAEQMDGGKTIQLPVMAFDLAPGPDREKVIAYCGVCHGVEYIPMQPKLSRAQWSAEVTKMIKVFGAPVPPEDAERIIDYLATAYGSGK
jgi:cytochrome c553